MHVATVTAGKGADNCPNCIEVHVSPQTLVLIMNSCLLAVDTWTGIEYTCMLLYDILATILLACTLY